MSEGAYILFYMRSSPRPPRNSAGKPSNHHPSAFTKSKPPKSTFDHRQEPTASSNRNRHSYAKPSNLDFSDATSSDWSILSNSDDASFTTESTRDSFSTVDYADNTTDPVSSIFSTTLYAPRDYGSRNTISCRRFLTSGAHTRFMEEEQRSVLKSYTLQQHNTEKGYCYPNEGFGSSSSSSLYI